LQHFKRQASRILTPASRKVLAKAIQSAGTQASSPLSIQVEPYEPQITEHFSRKRLEPHSRKRRGGPARIPRRFVVSSARRDPTHPSSPRTLRFRSASTGPVLADPAPATIEIRSRIRRRSQSTTFRFKMAVSHVCSDACPAKSVWPYPVRLQLSELVLPGNGQKRLHGGFIIRSRLYPHTRSYRASICQTVTSQLAPRRGRRRAPDRRDPNEPLRQRQTARHQSLELPHRSALPTRRQTDRRDSPLARRLGQTSPDRRALNSRHCELIRPAPRLKIYHTRLHQTLTIRRSMTTGPGRADRRREGLRTPSSEHPASSRDPSRYP